MSEKSPSKKKSAAWFTIAVGLAAGLLAAVCWGIGATEGEAWADRPSPVVSGEPSLKTSSDSERPEQADTQSSVLNRRLDSWEKLLLKMSVLLEKAEDRSYDTKLMARQLIRTLRVVVILLFVIAFAVPISIWFLGRGALLGMPSDMAAALVAIEERQAKLVNIFKEIQDEMEVLQSVSGPDLKNLLSQAAEYMKQNEQDLRTAGESTRPKGR
ncbi:MAG: hypothetical protein AB1646_23080 [Thermodesulfobacteriota bacterium]